MTDHDKTAGTGPRPGDCYLCHKQVQPLAANPSVWPMELPYAGGNGKRRLYCMGCVIAAVDATEPTVAAPTGPAAPPTDDQLLAWTRELSRSLQVSESGSYLEHQIIFDMLCKITRAASQRQPSSTEKSK